MIMWRTVRTTANKVQRKLVVLSPEGIYTFRVPDEISKFDPNTAVELAYTPMEAEGLTRAKRFGDGSVLVRSGGIFYGVRPASLHHAAVALHIQQDTPTFTGVKYGATKTMEQNEVSTGKNRGWGARTMRQDQHGAPRQTCWRCQKVWGDHKVLETVEVRDALTAMRSGQHVRDIKRMLGLMWIVEENGTRTTIFSTSGAELDETTRSGIERVHNVVIGRNIPSNAQFRDFLGKPIPNMTEDAIVAMSDTLVTQTTHWAKLSNLDCAAPKLFYTGYQSVPSARRSGATIYMSEQWNGGGGTNYAPGKTAQSCNKCRAHIWQFLCRYTNKWKKSDGLVQRLDTISITDLVGGHDLRIL